MSITQISIFLENRAGQLSEITKILSENSIDLKALNIAETADYGILRIISDDSDKAAKLLRDNGFIVTETPVAAAAVPNKAGGLNDLLNIISKEEIDIEYMYSLIERGVDVAYMVFRVSDEARLLEVLSKNALETVSPQKLGLK